jgi:DHA2 family multidrug resistance protein
MAKETAEAPMTLRSWLAVFGAILGAFMAVLDIQITNASVKEITGGLGATIDEGSWISTSYLVAEIIIIPISGWLTRVLSLRVYLLWTSVLFLFFSVCCGFAWNLPSMIVFRALQGATGGALIPLAFQVILSLPPSKRNVGMALFSITATFAPAIGPTIGGYLTEAYHWSVIFFLNLVPGIFLVFTVLFAIDKEKMQLHLFKTLDGWGLLTMSIGLSSLTILLEEGERDGWFDSHMIVVLSFVAPLFLIAFFIIELRNPNAFINLRLLLQKNFGFGCLVNFAVGLAMYGALYLLPLYLSTIQHYGSVDIGKTMMWAGVPQLLILPFVPKILKRVDPRWMAFLGINIFALSCFMNCRMTSLFGYDQLMWSQIVRAVGQPMLMIPLSTITNGLIAREQVGSASGLFNMLRNLGGSVGIAALSTMMTEREHYHSAILMESFNRYSHAAVERIRLMTRLFYSQGYDLHSAQMKAVAAMDATVRQQANVMGFNDCFLAVGVALALSSALILLCDRVQSAGGAEGAH